jgi:hypothetical protein|tara:strand:- start:3817 stop:4344 length:528 start_codon:yes stop_codon:yes gene_type:complete
MKIITHFEKPVKKQIFFYEVELEPFDENYFIEKIEKGILENNNNNFKSDVQGEMTSFQFFVEDPFLEKILKNFLRGIKFERGWGIVLVDAWGIKMTKGCYTNYHDHIESSYSGILYLSKSSVPLILPELNKKIYPEKYKILFFDSFLNHGTEKIIDETKYAIAFNFKKNKYWKAT